MVPILALVLMSTPEQNSRTVGIAGVTLDARTGWLLGPDLDVFHGGIGLSVWASEKWLARASIVALAEEPLRSSPGYEAEAYSIGLRHRASSNDSSSTDSAFFVGADAGFARVRKRECDDALQRCTDTEGPRGYASVSAGWSGVAYSHLTLEPYLEVSVLGLEPFIGFGLSVGVGYAARD